MMVIVLIILALSDEMTIQHYLSSFRRAIKVFLFSLFTDSIGDRTFQLRTIGER